MNPKKFKIILVDDHTLLRDALSSLIHSFEEFSVINSLNNGTELIRALSEGYKPDIVLLDLNMPILDGFETAKWLNVNYPEIKILILTMYDSEIALIRLLKVGVKGFLKKDTHPNELRVALNAVSENGYYYSQDTTGKLANLFQNKFNPDFTI